MTEQHSTFKEEEQRLDFTKRYMEVIIKTSESSKDQFRRNMQEAFGDADWTEGGLYSELLTTASFFEMSQTELESLKKAQRKPYFARVDFNRDSGTNTETLYFGKTSLYQRESQEQLIVDWRSPIANLYYEGRLGKVVYQAEGESFAGEITLKRQLMIENGKLDEVRDIDLTTTDELLQESLSRSSSNRLTEIVSTIQEEQNKIIRADLNKPIIVQGAAGSGKTTIALHRISYFIYTYKELFDARDLMILAPSNLFLDYISEELPELGVERAKQYTFTDYVQYAIGKKVKLSEDRKLINILEKDDQDTQEAVWISGLKGSNTFLVILDSFIKDIFSRFHPSEDFYCDKYRLYSAKKFIKLLENDYWYLPLNARVEKLKNLLQKQVSSKKKYMTDRVTDFYDNKIEKALNKRLDSESRKEYVTKCLDRKTERQAEIKKAIRNAVPGYFKPFKLNDLLEYYDELFLDPEKLATYSAERLTKADAERICLYQSKLKSNKCYEVEDMGPVLYLYAKLFGVPKEKRAKNIIIDEAQDYSFLSLYSLKTALETDMFTLVGDLAQGIHSYRGLETWDEVRQGIFPRATYAELKKSYRTTVEIMNEANKLLKKLPYDFPQVEPVVRHGEKPSFYSTARIGWPKELMQQVNQQYQKGFRTFAIITKTLADCEKAYSLLGPLDKRFCLLGEHASIPRDSIVILPSYLAKGLEFDVVYALSLDEIYDSQNELDIKLLYVVMTRPLHQLFFYGSSKEDFLLH